MRRLRVIAERGSIQGEQQSRQVGGVDGIFELKGAYVRVFYFNFEGRIIVCSHGVLKPKKKRVIVEARKAARLRDEVTQAARERRLLIEEGMG